MKFSALVASTLLAGSATARSTIFSSSPAITFDDSLSVPGKNPLQHCADPKDDILTLKSVDLDPNPPKAGTKLVVNGTGTLSADVEEGAYIALSVKYGLIRIINQKADLCETVKQADLECPLKKDDEVKLTQEVNLPKEIPPGKYTAVADVYTKDDQKITCLQAVVEFHLGGKSNDQEVLVDWKQGL